MSSVDFNLNDAAAVESALALGLKKFRLPNGAFEAMPPLDVIALAAERHVYADANVQSNLALVDVHPPQDQRSLLPAPLRPALLRVVGHPSASNPVWEAFCRSIDRHLQLFGYRVHPFDCCRLEKYLAATAPKPGTYEYWYRRQLSPRPAGHAEDEINWDNWQHFGKTEQQAFLLQQRSADPDAARQSMEKDFGAAAASLRQMYVETLAVGLSDADQAFLEGLNADRSGKVMEAAQRLLARFPGSAAAQQNREALAERLETQFLTRKIGLAKQKGKKASEALQELSVLIEYMSIEDIAAALNLPPDDLPRKIDTELAFPFARSAAFSQRYALALSLLQKEQKNSVLVQIHTIAGWFEHAALPDKLQLAEAAATWLAGADALDKLQVLALYQLLQQALPEKPASALLNGKAFKTACLQSVAENPYLAGNAMEALAACALLMPDSMSEAFSGKVKSIPFRSELNPLDYLALVEALKLHANE